jgi:hypothetical protein
MQRTHVVLLMAVIVAVPAAATSSFFAANTKPCFSAGRAGYEFTGSASATHTIRIDNATATPSLRMQIVDDPTAADFVLVDDGDTTYACNGVSAIESIRIDPAAAKPGAKPSITVALSRAPADYKIYVKSANYSEQDGAALFAVILQNAGKTGSIKTDSLGKSAKDN